MPAIQLARLKIQITELLTYFESPGDFLSQLHELFGFYADRTRRPGQSGSPKPLIRAYNIPKQVIRRIKSDIAVYIVEDPKSALALADALWEDNWFECRYLAIHILGAIPLENPSVVIERLWKWGKDCHEDELLESLLGEGAARIRGESPNEYQILVENWLSDNELFARKMGLRALPALILNPEFENLPIIFRLLSPMIREPTSMLEIDLTKAVRALGRRSPQETAYFLEQNIIASHKAGTSVIIRRSVDVFPADLQMSLRESLRKRMRPQSYDVS